MIGIVVAGHGHFAEGLLSSLKMIAGVPEKVIAVNFLEGDSTDTLDQNLLDAVNKLECKDVVILTDIAGGSPFRHSVLLSKKIDHNVKIFSGTNLPFLLQAVFNREIDIENVEKTWISTETQIAPFKERVKEVSTQEGGI